MSAAFEKRKRIIVTDHPPGRGVLTPREISTLLTEELSFELSLATAGYFDPDRNDAELARSHRIYGEAYRTAAKNGGECFMAEEDQRRLEAASWTERDIRAVSLILKHYCSAEGADIERRLLSMGLSPTPALVSQARVHLLRARAEAQDRAAMFPAVETDHPFDPLAELMAMTSARSPIPPVALSKRPKEENTNCPFISNDRRKLSEIAEDICAGLITDGVWRAPADQQRRIVGSFVWITGDKPIGDYRQEDASNFKRSLQQLPLKFRWKHESGVPFREVLARQEAITDLTQRSAKTVNRDLSTMSSFYEGMRTAGPWKPVLEGSTVLNFASLQDAVEDDAEAPPRVPWQESHLREIFSSPIFQGNAGAKKRLKVGSSTPQDGAYWCPMLLYWTLAARDEICGLELDDIFHDEPIPYLHIRKNSTRDLKRNARKRRIPLASEILRLGFRNYVSSLRATGEKHLFPELYINKKKTGGAQFYAICWVYLMNWLADRSNIPSTEAGKEADIHSVRTFGASILDKIQVSPNIVKDIMGHARQGVTAKSYQKRTLVLGEPATLNEMLEVIEGHLPAVTEEVPVSPLLLLPLGQRSRCGSARPRKVRMPRGNGTAS